MNKLWMSLVLILFACSPDNFGEPTHTAESTLPPDTYRVQEGDTCESIALIFDIPAYYFVEINGLSIDCPLNAGMVIKIPAYQKLDNPSIPEGAFFFNCGDKVDHTVRAGETLEDISSFYGMSEEFIMNWNGKTTKDLLLGDSLQIPLCQELDYRVTPTPNN